MENCAKVDSLLGAYADEELGAEETKKVALHLENCSLCEQSFQEIKTFAVLATSYKAPSVSDRQWDQCFAGCLEKISQLQPSQNSPQNSPQDGSSSSLPYWWILGTAAIAAALLAYALLSPWLHSPVKPGPVPVHSPAPAPPQVVHNPEKAPIKQVSPPASKEDNNESYLEYVETGEEYTYFVDVPSTKEEMYVITVGKQE